MLKVVMLDLGDTLVANDALLPFSLEALGALRQFETAAGEPLERCLVSDYRMPDEAVPTESVRSITAEYVRMIDGLGIGKFFRPTSRRVTLSTHAGATKPDRAVYATALERLGGGRKLSECVVVSEDAAHIAACREFEMKGLVFGTDVADWPDAVLAIRYAVAPGSVGNTTRALGLSFATTYGAKVTGVEGRPTAKRATALVRLPRRQRAEPVAVRFGDNGHIESVAWPPGAAELAEEAATSVGSLRRHGQLASGDGPLPPGATHRLDPATGRAEWERYSAV